MSDHAETALDQLQLADSCANDQRLTRTDEHLGYLVKSVVHALLDVATAVREARPISPQWDVVDAAIHESDCVPFQPCTCGAEGTS